jgi:ElaB/YqjD/DUF883 family membrane-anchored ribosome-binding protein
MTIALFAYTHSFGETFQIDFERSSNMETNSKPNGSAAASDIRNGVERNASSAAAAAHSAVDRLSDAAHPAVDRLSAGAHQTVDKLSGAATAAAGMFQQRTEQFNTAGSQFTENFRGYVKDNPLAVIGIAALTGFVLSRLLSSR